MLEIDIQDDDVLKNCIDKMISGLLPHEKYNAVLFPEIYAKISQLIKPEETYGEYCVLLKTINEFRRMGAAYTNYEYNITRDALISVLDANIMDLVRNPAVKIEQVLANAGMESNISIETVFSNACSFLYNQTLDLYDECFKLKVSSEEAVSYFPSLKSAFVSNQAGTSLLNQAKILKESAFVDRRVYQGPEDWLKYVTDTKNEIVKRADEDTDTAVRLNSVDVGFNLLEECYGMFEPLADYDIPLLDDGTPMLRHRLVLTVGNENVGKTSFAINWVNNLVLAGKRVLYMCGETLPSKVYSMLLVNYIYKTQGKYIDRQAIAKRGALDPESQRIVNTAVAEYTTKDLVELRHSFSYDNLYDELQAAYDNCPFDAVFIDHSCALRGKGDLYTNIGTLAIQARNFKNDFPVYINILSHLSSSAKELINKGKNVSSSVSKGNSSLDAEADEIFVLSCDENQKAKGQVMMTVTKRRDESPLTSPLILIKKFEVCSFYYDPSLQNSDEDFDMDVQELDNFYDEDDDIYLLDDSDF